MQQSELSGKMHGWAKEYFLIKNCDPDLPDGLWRFLASRIADSSSSFQQDDDVVCAKFGSAERNVKITGTRRNMLVCVPSDGTPGMFLCKVSDILAPHRSKLTTILNRLEQEGKT